MITQKQFREALVVVESYCSQVEKLKIGLKTHEIGCKVKLSAWGKEMQGKSNKIGVVVDFSEGAVNKITDGCVCVKWDGVSKPNWMHISQVEIIKLKK